MILLHPATLPSKLIFIRIINKLAGDFFLVTIQEEKTVAMPKMEGEQFEVASEAQRRIFELE